MRGRSLVALAAAAPLSLVAWWSPLPDQGTALAVLRWLPWAIAGLLCVSAWRFRRGRVALAALAVALAGPELAGLAPAAVPAARPERALACGLLAAALGLCALARSRPAFSRATLLLAAPALGLPVLAGPLARGDVVPPSAGLALLLGGALAAAAAWLGRGGALEAAILGALVPVAMASLFDAGPARLGALLAVPGALLALGLAEDVYRLAWHDELTGLPGRRAFDSDLAELHGRWAVAMADIDHFKRFNDRFGHAAGDQVLRLVASRLARVRGGRAYRWGGEEFAVLFPSADLAGAREALEDVRRAIACRPFVVRGADRPRRRPERPRPVAGPRRSARVTVSFGLSARWRGASADEVVRAADRALYRAKRAGRNRVVTARRDRR